MIEQGGDQGSVVSYLCWTDFSGIPDPALGLGHPYQLCATSGRERDVGE